LLSLDVLDHGSGNGKSTTASNGLQNAKCNQVMNIPGACTSEARRRINRKPDEKYRSAAEFITERSPEKRSGAEKDEEQNQGQVGEIHRHSEVLCHSGKAGR